MYAYGWDASDSDRLAAWLAAFPGVVKGTRPGHYQGYELARPLDFKDSGSYIVGTVTSDGDAAHEGLTGGVVDRNKSNRGIVACYAVVRVTGNHDVGGLVGCSGPDRGGFGVIDSYAHSVVTGGRSAGELVGHNGSGDILASYWVPRETTAGVGGGNSNDAQSKEVENLKSPMGYVGIYADWDQHYSAQGYRAQWDFGTSDQLPALKVDFDGDGVATWQEFGDQPR